MSSDLTCQFKVSEFLELMWMPTITVVSLELKLINHIVTLNQHFKIYFIPISDCHKSAPILDGTV